MSTQPVIRILEVDSNKRGDLFGRLMKDLFLALGYDRARLNIHKSGREIDIEAQHRTEPRRVIAECKATGTPIGGDDVNKFVGSLDVERRKRTDLQTEGYYVSLSGFTETAIEQEKETGDRRLILLSADRVVEELALGRIVVSEKTALELAGRCVRSDSIKLSLDTETELLAHEVGWIWVAYFQQNKERTHFALVHADGNFLSSNLARTIIASDQTAHGSLHVLQYLSPPTGPASEADIGEAQQKYFSYLAYECGEIQLEGLPADQEVGSRRLRLENLFVPLHLIRSIPPSQELPANMHEDSFGVGTEKPSAKPKRARRKRITKKPAQPAREEGPERVQLGQVLSEYPRVAILGLPGGGKSTLLKRLATAYAFPDRRHLVDDGLPERNWLPLFVRCRQLGTAVRSPITVILQQVGSRAEMTMELARSFNALVSQKLRDGEVLLLVDGLDEISDEADRVCFVGQLRTFLATYPRVALGVTSREAGFRIIGGALSGQCEHFILADFDEADIKRLTLSWHKEVVGNTPQVRADAEKLAATISANHRLQNLASNPLLLTTLLLVKRWIGQLPTKRTVLYGKAIEVLLMTWNVEGHQPLDPEEVLPQLEYLATAMMREGIQSITSKKLTDVLNAARAEMPEILGYARISVSEFIRRVELRSSLLMLSGHVVEDGTVCPTYEFRHLTFQEYLVAGALVNGHYPGRTEKDDLLELLRSHLNDERWREIVPLAAVLAGRKVQPLVACLVQLCHELPSTPPWGSGGPLDFEEAHTTPASLLAACLADEIQASPELLKDAVRCVIHHDINTGLSTAIGSAKYGDTLYEAATQELQTTERDIMRIETNLLGMFPEQVGWSWESPVRHDLLARIERNLLSPDPMGKTRGCLAAMELAYLNHTRSRREKGAPLHQVDSKQLHAWLDLIFPLRTSKPLYLQCAALWAIVWLSQLFPWTAQEIPERLLELVELWRTSTSADIRYLSSWMISEMPLIDRAGLPKTITTTDIAHFLDERQIEPRHMYEFPAAIMSAYFLQAPWSDDQLAELVERHTTGTSILDQWKQDFFKLIGRKLADDPQEPSHK